jgi:hypothetical protein
MNRRLIVATLLILLALVGCRNPSVDEPEPAAQLHDLESKAAQVLDLALPINIQGLDVLNCACLEGQLIDARNQRSTFCIYSDINFLGAGDGHWGVSAGKCLPQMNDERNGYLVDQEEQKALGVLLGGWVVREFPSGTRRSIRDRITQSDGRVDLTEKESIALTLLRLAELAEDPTMRDLLAYPTS